MKTLREPRACSGCAAPISSSSDVRFVDGRRVCRKCSSFAVAKDTIYLRFRMQRAGQVDVAVERLRQLRATCT